MAFGFVLRARWLSRQRELSEVFRDAPRLLVELDQRKTVQVGMPPGILFEKGRAILLIERTTSVFHRKVYTFLRYDDREPENKYRK